MPGSRLGSVPGEESEKEAGRVEQEREVMVDVSPLKTQLGSLQINATSVVKPSLQEPLKRQTVLPMAFRKQNLLAGKHRLNQSTLLGSF